MLIRNISQLFGGLNPYDDWLNGQSVSVGPLGAKTHRFFEWNHHLHRWKFHIFRGLNWPAKNQIYSDLLGSKTLILLVKSPDHFQMVDCQESWFSNWVNVISFMSNPRSKFNWHVKSHATLLWRKPHVDRSPLLNIAMEAMARGKLQRNPPSRSLPYVFMFRWTCSPLFYGFSHIFSTFPWVFPTFSQLFPRKLPIFPAAARAPGSTRVGSHHHETAAGVAPVLMKNDWSDLNELISRVISIGLIVMNIMNHFFSDH